MQRPIYMDHHATTPVDPRVIEAMLPLLRDEFGNASSRSHAFGRAAHAVVERAREQVAALLNAHPAEIVFTSGGTESDNLAIKGVARMRRERGNHIVTSAVEHRAVLDSCRHLEAEGFETTYVPVDATGAVHPERVAAAITERTILCSVMLANNEIGTINPIREIGALCRERGIPFHCDAVQGFGKIPFDVREMNVDLASVTAHKIYGPKGVGALYVGRRPRVRLAPLLHGGGHERGLRSGTPNAPAAAGFGLACEVCLREREGEARRVAGLRDRLHRGLEARLEEVTLNGHPTRRIPGNLNLCFRWVEGEALMGAMPEVALSSGSACASADLEPSHVLQAIGLGDDLLHSSIRFGLGRFNTIEEVDTVVDCTVRAVRRLREQSPRWAARAAWRPSGEEH